MGWIVLAAGLAILVAAVRIGSRGPRGTVQGLAVLLVAVGGLMLLRRPGAGFHLPGYGPRQWRQP